MSARDDLSGVLLSEEQINKIVKDLGKRISEDYQDKNLFVICVLKGSFIFAADLMRSLTIPCRMDFLAASSYGSGSKSSGNVRIIKDVAASLEGLDVLIVEDILDSGNTLSRLKKLLSERHPASLRICTMLDKPARRETPLEADYVGTVVPDEFLVGYGLDYNEYYRELPMIGILKREIYSN